MGLAGMGGDGWDGTAQLKGHSTQYLIFFFFPDLNTAEMLFFKNFF